MKKTPKQQTQIRMDDDLKDRIRKYQRRFERETGAEISFSGAVRLLIEKGIDSAEQRPAGQKP